MVSHHCFLSHSAQESCFVQNTKLLQGIVKNKKGSSYCQSTIYFTFTGKAIRKQSEFEISPLQSSIIIKQFSIVLCLCDGRWTPLSYLNTSYLHFILDNEHENLLVSNEL